jgi:hypothetical protein
MGLKRLGIGGSFTFGVKRWFRGGKVSSNIHLGANLANEGFKLGREVMFQGFHFFIYGGMHVVIDGGNIDTELPHFLLGLCEIKGQVLRWASRSWLWVWAMMKGETRKGRVGPHKNGLWVKGIMMIRVMRGIQWGKSQIRGLKRGRVHKKKNIC